jgi:hypothetical protein
MARIATQLVSRWLQSDQSDDLLALNEMVEALRLRLYRDYEPNQFVRFEDRLDHWLSNISDEEDQKTLYRLLGELFFVGREEFAALCRAALHGPIARWIAKDISLSFTDPDAHRKLSDAINRTWFCPITDSLRINAFLKINSLRGHEYRPDWRSLARFGSVERIREFTKHASIDRIALIEDFVGTGNQMSDALCFAAGIDPKMSVMACPLVICPEGIEKAAELIKKHGNLAFDPVLSLRPSSFIKFEPQLNEPPLYEHIRSLIAKIAPRLSIKSGRETHGYEGMGALTVLYSNCPDNTLLLVYDHTNDWEPLFPRVERNY